MAKPITDGLFAALDLAAFHELPDGSFEVLDQVPGWYLELDPDATGSSFDLSGRFPFLENFLVDAHEFWRRPRPGRLRSGPWTEVTPAGLERNLEATAVFHRESRILLIGLLGEAYEETRAVLQTARDAALTHRRLARLHEAFIASETDARALLRSIPDTLFRIRSDGAYLDFSELARPSEPKKLTDVLPEALARRFLEHVEKALADGTPRTFEYASDLDGGPRELEARIARCESDEVLVLVRDVTERKAAERELFGALLTMRSHRDELLLILNQLRVGAILTDERERCTFLSDPAKLLFGLPEDQVLGKNWRDLPILGADQAAELEEMSKAPAAMRRRIPLHWTSDDGREYWMEADLRDDPREPRQKILFLYDVTQVHDLRRQLDEKGSFEELVGKSRPMQQVYQLIEDFAPVDATALIEGETGSGKELVAKALHHRSARGDGPFVALNCAALSESLAASQLFGHRRGSFTGAIQDQRGVFEAANGGVLFLDEIGDIPPAVQTSLLRVLQEKEIVRVGETTPRRIDVRVIAATHRDLNQEVREGRFREDLLYRIRVARIRIPPLRERAADVPLLVSRFLGELRAAMGKPLAGVSAEAMRRLTTHHWPGNVRELRSALELAAIRTRTALIELSDLPPEIHGAADAAPFIDGEDEKQRYLDALEQAAGNRTKAARLLGVSRATFYRRLTELELSPKS